MRQSPQTSARCNSSKAIAVRFGTRYRDELAASEDIALVLNSYVTSLEGDGQAINALNLWLPDGQSDRFQGGLCGRRHGRHREFAAAALVQRAEQWGRLCRMRKRLAATGWNIRISNAETPSLNDVTKFEIDADGEAFFSPSWDAMQRKGILNFGIRLVEMPYEGMKDAGGRTSPAPRPAPRNGCRKG
jgi:hypothetical protein